MLDRNFIRENPGLVRERAGWKKVDIDTERFLKLDENRRGLLQQGEELKRQRNVASKEIGDAKKKGISSDEAIAAMREVSDRIKDFEKELKTIDDELNDFELSVPNMPHESVPVGKDEECNLEVRRWGDIPEFDFEPRPHWELGEILDILDFARGAKITGARFTLLKGAGALMERALINFMLDIQTAENGYREVLPPFIVNAESLIGTGNLPKFEADLFKLQGWNYYLIPTAEVPVTNIHRDEILEGSELPKYYTAFSPCFRSEAGSYGEDTRGMIRQHQFNKVELVKFVTPETSYDELEKLVDNSEEILRRLGLHYRVVTLCTGDMTFSSAKTYDIEVWLPSQKRFREISSCSNFEDFQARRANIRYRPEKGDKPRFLHTLNGSGLAIGRTVIAILENYQNRDGSVTVPEALRPYMRGLERIERK